MAAETRELRPPEVFDLRVGEATRSMPLLSRCPREASERLSEGPWVRRGAPIGRSRHERPGSLSLSRRRRPAGGGGTDGHRGCRGRQWPFCSASAGVLSGLALLVALSMAAAPGSGATIELSRAGVSQLVESLLPKQNVAGSSPVSRSSSFQLLVTTTPWLMAPLDWGCPAIRGRPAAVRQQHDGVRHDTKHGLEVSDRRSHLAFGNHDTRGRDPGRIVPRTRWRSSTRESESTLTVPSRSRPPLATGRRLSIGVTPSCNRTPRQNGRRSLRCLRTPVRRSVRRG